MASATSSSFGGEATDRVSLPPCGVLSPQQRLRDPTPLAMQLASDAVLVGRIPRRASRASGIGTVGEAAGACRRRKLALIRPFPTRRSKIRICLRAHGRPSVASESVAAARAREAERESEEASPRGNPDCLQLSTRWQELLPSLWLWASAESATVASSNLARLTFLSSSAHRPSQRTAARSALWGSRSQTGRATRSASFS
jgi:hypothetical protein